MKIQFVAKSAQIAGKTYVQLASKVRSRRQPPHAYKASCWTCFLEIRTMLKGQLVLLNYRGIERDQNQWPILLVTSFYNIFPQLPSYQI